MPWTIEKRKGKYFVVKEDTGEAVDKGYGSKEQAAAHLGALYANVPEAHRKLAKVDWETDREKACCSDCEKTGGKCGEDEHLKTAIKKAVESVTMKKAVSYG